MIGNVTTIDFCPFAPFHFTATNSTRVRHPPSPTRSPFSAYSGQFRADGKLLVVGRDRQGHHVGQTGAALGEGKWEAREEGDWEEGREGRSGRAVGGYGERI
ncbi:unnamed protein product [Closterium sp. Naga37s-1]|nr:unnamed protein product [Closterium sp. Naga37s-1]